MAPLVTMIVPSYPAHGLDVRLPHNQKYLQQLCGPVFLLDSLVQLPELLRQSVHLLLELPDVHGALYLDLADAVTANQGAGVVQEIPQGGQPALEAVPLGQQVGEGGSALHLGGVVGAVDGRDQLLQPGVIRLQLRRSSAGSSAGFSPSWTWALLFRRLSSWRIRSEERRVGKGCYS